MNDLVTNLCRDILTKRFCRKLLGIVYQGFLSFREGREKRERGREKKGEGKGEREWSVGQRGRARREFEKELRGRERGGGRRI